MSFSAYMCDYRRCRDRKRTRLDGECSSKRNKSWDIELDKEVRAMEKQCLCYTMMVRIYTELGVVEPGQKQYALKYAAMFCEIFGIASAIKKYRFHNECPLAKVTGVLVLIDAGQWVGILQQRFQGTFLPGCNAKPPLVKCNGPRAAMQSQRFRSAAALQIQKLQLSN